MAIWLSLLEEQVDESEELIEDGRVIREQVHVFKNEEVGVLCLSAQAVEVLVMDCGEDVGSKAFGIPAADPRFDATVSVSASISRASRPRRRWLLPTACSP